MARKKKKSLFAFLIIAVILFVLFSDIKINSSESYMTFTTENGQTITEYIFNN